ncbi:MAG: tetratricopeptide repeat protein [Proteobacteria bacterium]|nr:tetratricopeptide repeat protein [Pseudomonadota bacterium]MBU1585482.1 tetratricopeptide repeat protein [Pseudomonadota bacterium]MBU2453903.1 tetratricopeptide repeat protein [Pseudomonadota bacterium]MBU2632085.1 tetratricopeptide repeat protein [Pseudomonadota bacterium]
MQTRLFKLFIFLFLIIFLASCTAVVGWKDFGAGKEYYQQSSYNNAIKKFSESIKQNPTHWNFYYYRGLAYIKLKKTNFAIRDLTKSLELLPTVDTWYSKLPKDEWALIYVRRGMLYNEEGVYDLALKDYIQALELDSNCVGAYFYRGITEEKLNKFSEALEDYTKAIDLMSYPFSGIGVAEKIRVYLHRAFVYREQNLLQLALKDNNQAINIKGTWEAYLSRSITHTKLGNYDNAITDLDRTIELNPIAGIAYLLRSDVKQLKNCNLNQVLEDSLSALNVHLIDKKTKQEIYNGIAWILATAADDGIRDAKNAIVFAKKSVQIEENFTNLDTLAVALAATGKFEEAISIEKKAIDLCKKNHPKYLSIVENHLDALKNRKEIREECPGLNFVKEYFGLKE